MSRYEVRLGDCREQLRELGDASIDAIVTDPPYELGFMGKSWDSSGIAYDVGLWREALRVLKPGGHLLAFGATRTYHRLAVAIEDAGFEIRDSIHWLYGSGFPKSLDVSKAIDKAAGARGHEGRNMRSDDGTGTASYRATVDPREYVRPPPATDAAKTWLGWGTALKPAHEPIVVARKPLDGTVAANVLAHGVGGINVDGCRVKGSDVVSISGASATLGGTSAGWDRPWKSDPAAVAARQQRAAEAIEKANTLGRWPPNVIFSHLPACRPIGTRRVKGGGGTHCSNRDTSGRCLGHGNAGRSTSGATFHGSETVSEGQTEVVETWACAEGCAVAELDAQSGTRTSGKPGGAMRQQRGTFSANATDTPLTGYGDTGGASRFFPAFRYQAKPSRRERDAGLRDAKAGALRMRTDAHAERTGQTTAPRANTHPTVKPVELMRWCIRLVTPKGGTVLDPFTGSGTTGIAAMLEDARFVGVELSPDYRRIAVARIEGALAVRAGEQLDLFDLEETTE